MKINSFKFVKICKYALFTLVAVVFSYLPFTNSVNNIELETAHADTPAPPEPAPACGDGSGSGGDGI